MKPTNDDLWDCFGNPDIKIKEVKKMEKEEITDFGDAYEGGKMFEGEQVEFSDVLNKQIVIKDFKEIPSTFHEGNFAIVQAEMDGNLVTFPTGSSVLMKQLSSIREKLPVRAKIMKPKGKRYYTFV